MVDGAPIRVALACVHLGRRWRGFEVATTRWFDELARVPGLEVRLFAGGAYPGATEVASLSWDGHLGALADRLRPGRDDHQGARFWLENASFALGLAPHLRRFRPHVVWTKNLPVARLLVRARPALGLRTRVVLSNGGPWTPAACAGLDYVQFLEPSLHAEALAHGLPPERVEVVPNFLPAPPPPVESRAALRAAFGLRDGDWTIVCVAAWNRHHKRLHHLIKEVAAADLPDAKLVLCGHPGSDTASLMRLGERRLGERVVWRTLPPADVWRLLHAADAFVLPSLREALGNATVEAALAPLPVLVHPHPAGRFILPDPRWHVDCERPGALAARLRALHANPVEAAAIEARRRDVLARFSSSALVNRFVATLRRAAAEASGAATPVEITWP